MFYPLPRSRIVDRERYLVDLCIGRNVVHLGAAQANDSNDFRAYGTTINPTEFLHSRISAVANRCVGLDYNQHSIDHLRDNYGISNIHYADVEAQETLTSQDFSADIILMGELLEHLPNPGIALSNIRERLMSDNSVLVVTTPNALDLSNFMYAFLHREAQDQDHVAVYSPRLFSRLCERTGLRVVDFVYYQTTIGSSGRNYYRVESLKPRKLLLFLIYNIALRLTPGLSHGLIMCVKKA